MSPKGIYQPFGMCLKGGLRVSHHRRAEKEKKKKPPTKPVFLSRGWLLYPSPTGPRTLFEMTKESSNMAGLILVLTGCLSNQKGPHRGRNTGVPIPTTKHGNRQAATRGVVYPFFSPDMPMGQKPSRYPSEHPNPH